MFRVEIHNLTFAASKERGQSDFNMMIEVLTSSGDALLVKAIFNSNDSKMISLVTVKKLPTIIEREFLDPYSMRSLRWRGKFQMQSSRGGNPRNNFSSLPGVL